MSVLNQVVYIWFHFKKRDEMKKKWKRKTIKNENMKINKMKTKWKQNEIKNKMNKVEKGIK